MISPEIQKINGEIEIGNYENAIKLCNALDEHSLNGKLLKTLFLSDIYIFQGDFDKVERYFDTARLEINETSNDYLKIYYTNVFSGYFIRKGDLEKSSLLLTQQYDLVNNLVTKKAISKKEKIYSIWIARYFHTSGNLFLKLGKLEEATGNYGKSIKIKQEIKDLIGIASSLNKLSIIRKFQGRLLESIEMCEESIRLYDQIGNVQAMATTLMTMAIINRELKQESQALENLEKCLFYLQKEQNPYLLALVNHEMFITLSENNRELAFRFFREIQNIFTENPNNEGIQLVHDLTKAVYLKTSKRGKDKYESQKILTDIVNRKLIDYRITIYAILNLMELQLKEFQSYGEEEVFLEIVDWIERLKLIAITHDSLLLTGEINLIEAKFELLKGNITNTNIKFDAALSFAEFNGLDKLADKILKEKTMFESQLQKWETLSRKGALLINELTKNELDNYIEQIASLRELA